MKTLSYKASIIIFKIAFNSISSHPVFLLHNSHSDIYKKKYSVERVKIERLEMDCKANFYNDCSSILL